MLLKINKSTVLATGQSAAACVVDLFNEIPKLSAGVIFADIKVWSSLANKNGGKDHTYLHHAIDDKRTTNFIFTIPAADIVQAGTDGHFGIIGQKYPDYMKEAVAEIAGCAVTDIEILSLI